MIHDNVIRDFTPPILRVGQVSYRKIKEQEYLKMTVHFQDGSTLQIREFYDHQKLLAYSYYWLDPNKKLIIGWDNSPHHYKLKTHPHHKHMGNQTNVLESHENNLRQVLSFIKKKFGA